MYLEQARKFSDQLIDHLVTKEGFHFTELHTYPVYMSSKSSLIFP